MTVQSVQILPVLRAMSGRQWEGPPEFRGSQQEKVLRVEVLPGTCSAMAPPKT